MSKSKNINEDVIIEHKRISRPFISSSLNSSNLNSVFFKFDGEQKVKSKSEIEKESIYEALLKFRSISEAAKNLNMSRVTLWRKMKKYGINWR